MHAKDHTSVLNTLNIPGHVDDDYELPYLYWIPKLHKNTLQAKIHCWSQKMFYKTSVDTRYKNTNCCEGEASCVLCHCICQKWG
jgi:hypothetical protein